MTLNEVPKIETSNADDEKYEKMFSFTVDKPKVVTRSIESLSKTGKYANPRRFSIGTPAQRKQTMYEV